MLCSGCEMIGMLWYVQDVGYFVCGMFRMWDVRDVRCLGCWVWDVVCLLGCEMLIYKIPKLGIIFLVIEN